jgi:hypothetical protein
MSPDFLTARQATYARHPKTAVQEARLAKVTCFAFGKLGHMRWKRKCVAADVRDHAAARLACGDTTAQVLFEDVALTELEDNCCPCLS